jgi:hypothetical protein
LHWGAIRSQLVIADRRGQLLHLLKSIHANLDRLARRAQLRLLGSKPDHSQAPLSIARRLSQRAVVRLKRLVNPVFVLLLVIKILIRASTNDRRHSDLRQYNLLVKLTLRYLLLFSQRSCEVYSRRVVELLKRLLQ